MRRLYQLGTLLLTMATFLAPISEWFDRWDTPGLSNDIEFGIFVLVFALVLILVLCKLTATLALRLTLRRTTVSPHVGRSSFISLGVGARIFIPPHLSQALRI